MSSSKASQQVKTDLDIRAGGREVGPALLFYGCHSPDTDLLYDAEMAEWQKQGVVKIRHAFSRANEQSEGCKYVQ